MNVLERLLAPISPERFFADHWARAAVVMRGQPERFDELFGWRSLDDYLNHRLRFFAFPAVQLFFGEDLGGGRVPSELFVESIRDANRCPLSVVSPDKVRQLCAEGATLMVHSVHDGDPSVKAFAAALEHALGETLRVDLFYTPPDSTGVHAHFDREDVFVLQVEGAKEWHLSAPTVEHPLAPPDYAELERAPRMPDAVQRLNRGDVLHIPRGAWHATRTGSKPSLHLSVRIACRTGVDLLRFAVDQLEKHDPATRANLPLALQRAPAFGYAQAPMRAAIDLLQEKLQQQLSAPDVVDRFNRWCVAGDRAPRPYQFSASRGLGKVTLDAASVLSRPALQRVLLVDGSDTVTVVASGHELVFSRRARGLLEALVGASRTSLRDLLAAHPEHSSAEVHGWVARLLEVGIVEIAVGGQSHG